MVTVIDDELSLNHGQIIFNNQLMEVNDGWWWLTMENIVIHDGSSDKSPASWVNWRHGKACWSATPEGLPIVSVLYSVVCQIWFNYVLIVFVIVIGVFNHYWYLGLRAKSYRLSWSVFTTKKNHFLVFPQCGKRLQQITSCLDWCNAALSLGLSWITAIG